MNGGIVGVTGAAGIGVVNNRTKASVNDNAVIFARDSMRVHASDDTEIDAVAVAGAVGGVAGASGSVGVYVVKSTTESLIGENGISPPLVRVTVLRLIQAVLIIPPHAPSPRPVLNRTAQKSRIIIPSLTPALVPPPSGAFP